MKKIIPSIALAAALAMGTVPAFAAADSSTFDDSAAGSTEVKGEIKKTLSNIKATIPLQIVVGFAAENGSEIIGPTTKAMYIKNESPANAIQIMDVELEGVNTNFTFAPVAYDAGTETYSDPDTGVAPTENRLMFTWTTASKAGEYTGNNSAYLTTGHKLSQQKATVAEKTYYPGSKIYAKDRIEIGKQMPVEIGGYAYMASAIDATKLTDALCNLKITIAQAA